jgi:hypothetical protein
MNHHHPVTESETLVRAAKHLIQNHGSRAAAVAVKRATFLEQCGEIVAADTWHKIGTFVREIEAKGDHAVVSLAKPPEKAPQPSAKPVEAKRSAIVHQWPRPREAPEADSGAGVMAIPAEGGNAARLFTIERPF